MFDYITQPKSETVMPSVNHSYVCARILMQLFRYNEISVFPELTLGFGEEITPDISIYPIGEVVPDNKDSVRCEKKPIWIIEVVSPTQSNHHVIEKARGLVQRGIMEAWVFDPSYKIVLVITKDAEKIFNKLDRLKNKNVEIDLSEVFNF